jgi:hypothetical protein
MEALGDSNDVRGWIMSLVSGIGTYGIPVMV